MSRPGDPLYQIQLNNARRNAQQRLQPAGPPDKNGRPTKYRQIWTDNNKYSPANIRKQKAMQAQIEHEAEEEAKKLLESKIAAKAYAKARKEAEDQDLTYIPPNMRKAPSK